MISTSINLIYLYYFWDTLTTPGFSRTEQFQSPSAHLFCHFLWLFLLDGDINKFIFYCLSWQTCQKLCQVHLGNDQNWAFFCRSVAHWKFWPNFLSYNYLFSPRNVRGLKRSKIKWKNESVQLMHCYLTSFEQSGKNWGKQCYKPPVDL